MSDARTSSTLTDPGLDDERQAADNGTRATHPKWVGACVVGLRAGATAVALGLLTFAVPVGLGWVAADSEATAAQAARVVAQTWLVVSGAEVAFAGGRFGLAPLGFTLLLVALLAWVGRREGQRLRADVARASRRSVATATASGALVYALAASGLARLATHDAAFVDPVQAAVTATVPAVGALGLGLLSGSGRLGVEVLALPEWMRRTARPVAAAVSTLVAVGGVLVTAALLTHLSAISALARALDAGFVGGLLVALGGIAYLVNAVVWAIAYAAGPGFALGTGTSIGAGGITVGTLPPLPLLGAVPTDVPVFFSLFALAGPLMAGVLAGALIARRAIGDALGGLEAADRALLGESHSGPAEATQQVEWERVRRLALEAIEVDARPLRVAADGLLVGVVAGLCAGLASVVASGPAGPTLLAQVGAVPWQVTLAVGLEVGVVGAAVAVAVVAVRSGLLPRLSTQAVAEPEIDR